MVDDVVAARQEASIQFIEYKGDRVETGPVQLGADWPGLFIRGDNALHLLQQLRHAERQLERMKSISFDPADPFGLGISGVRRLRRLLASLIRGETGDYLRRQIDDE